MAERYPDIVRSRLLPVTKSIADRWAILSVQAQRQGTLLAIMDGLIAATGLERDLTVVIRNVKDFTGLGVAALQTHGTRDLDLLDHPWPMNASQQLYCSKRFF